MNTHPDQTISYDQRLDAWVVHEFDVYPDHSVLAGQDRKRFIASFDTQRAAMDAHPFATVGHRSANNTFGHLPGESDAAPGGMYLDDYEDGL